MASDFFFADDLSTPTARSSVTLVIPSRWCLAAAVQTNGLPRADRRSALIYRLEPAIPLAAEEVAVDFIFDEPRGTALGLCVPVARVKAVVDRLEAAGVDVDSITPVAAIAIRRLLGDRSRKPFDMVLWQDRDRIEVWNFRDRRWVGWELLPADPAEIADVLASSTGLRVLGFNLDDAVAAAVSGVPGAQLTTDGLDLTSYITGAKTGCDIEWRRDGLAPTRRCRAIRGPLVAAAIAAVVAIAAGIGAAVLRANQYDRQTADNDARQAAVFRAVLPGRPVPVNVTARLRAEARGPDAGADSPPSAAPQLRAVLGALAAVPASVRFELSDLRAADGQWSIEGAARSRDDVEKLINAFNADRSLKMDSPQTEQLPGREIHFTLSGQTAEAR
jgi:hypothetical protein